MNRYYARPLDGEYTPYMLDYISLVPDDGFIERHLADGEATLARLIRSFPRDRLMVPHATGEWTLQDILQHVTDNERVFAYRALRVARGDTVDLPGFEQDDFALAARANDRSIDDLLEEYSAVRRASLTLARSFTDEALTRIGRSNGNPLSTRAALYIIVGHELFHVRSIHENYGEA
jgi:hypothetical protein